MCIRDSCRTLPTETVAGNAGFVYDWCRKHAMIHDKRMFAERAFFCLGQWNVRMVCILLQKSTENKAEKMAQITEKVDVDVYKRQILGPIAKVLGWIMNGIFWVLDKIGIPNIGLAIIIFTIVIYLLLMPFTIKQQKFSKPVSYTHLGGMLVAMPTAIPEVPFTSRFG